MAKNWDMKTLHFMMLRVGHRALVILFKPWKEVRRKHWKRYCSEGFQERNFVFEYATGVEDLCSLTWLLFPLMSFYENLNFSVGFIEHMASSTLLDAKLSFWGPLPICSLEYSVLTTSDHQGFISDTGTLAPVSFLPYSSEICYPCTMSLGNLFCSLQFNFQLWYSWFA